MDKTEAGHEPQGYMTTPRGSVNSTSECKPPHWSAMLGVTPSMLGVIPRVLKVVPSLLGVMVY